MSPFDKHLTEIDNLISIKDEDRKPYTAIYDEVTNWLINGMRSVSPVFDKLYAGTCLFGSYTNGVRLLKPTEFDTMITIKFPYPPEWRVDKNRPGYLHMNLEKTLVKLSRDPNYRDVYKVFFEMVQNNYLRRDYLQNWIKGIIEKVIKTNTLKKYTILFQQRAVAQTIYVVTNSQPEKRVSIDIVPTFVIDNAHGLCSDIYKDYYPFYATPKNGGNEPVATKLLTFMMVNPVAERELLWNKNQLKVAYRLLKSLRDHYKMDRLKSVFLTTVFLDSVWNRKIVDWNGPISKIFLNKQKALKAYIIQAIRDLLPETINKDLEIWSDRMRYCEASRGSNLNELYTIINGSYPNRVRLQLPNEFDTLIVLSFKFPLSLSLEEDQPGYININMEDTLEDLANDSHYNDVYNEFYDLVDYNTGDLRRTNFRWWIHNIIKKAIQRPISGRYSISYQKRAVAHNIYVRDNWCERTVSLDFVPAISFGKVEWMHIRAYPPLKMDYFYSFYAIPKLPPGGKKSKRLYTFMMVNPEAERELLWDKNNLKVAYRLLKSLRDHYELDRLKSVFLTNIFLWEVKRRRHHFWQNSISEIFLHMLAKLCNCFIDRSLPYFWVRDMNLLDILKEEEIAEYTTTLCRAYDILDTYTHQPNLTFFRTTTYFDLPTDDESDEDD